MPKIKSPPGKNKKTSHKHNHSQNSMDKVKIKRVKKNKKKITVSEKVLAGIGLGSTLIGGAGAVAPKTSETQFVRTQSQEQGSSTSKVRDTLKRIFGIGKAQASGIDVQIIGPVVANVNDSLSADVIINGQTQNLAIIQSSGRAYDTSGQDVTDQLVAQGVDVADLLAKFQYAHNNPAQNQEPPPATQTPTGDYYSDEALINSVATFAWDPVNIGPAQLQRIQLQVLANMPQTFQPGSVMAYMMGVGSGTEPSPATISSGYEYQGGQWVKATVSTEISASEGDTKDGSDGYIYMYHQGNWVLQDGQTKTVGSFLYRSSNGSWILQDGQTEVREDGVYKTLSGQWYNAVPKPTDEYNYHLNNNQSAWVLDDSQTKTQSGKIYLSQSGIWVEQAPPAAAATKYTNDELLANINTIIYTGSTDIPDTQLAVIQPQILANMPESFLPGSVLAFMMGLGNSTQPDQEIIDKATASGYEFKNSQWSKIQTVPAAETSPEIQNIDTNNLPDSFNLNSDIAKNLGLRSDRPSTAEGDVPVSFLVLGDALYEWNGSQFVKSASGSAAATLINQGKYTEANWYQLYPNGPGVQSFCIGIAKDTAKNIAVLPLAMGAYSAALGGSFSATYSATLAVALSPVTLGIGAAITGAIIGIKAIVNRGQDKVRDTKRIESAYPYFNEIMVQYWSITPNSIEESQALHDAAKEAIQGIFDTIPFEKDSSRTDQQRWLQINYYDSLDQTLAQRISAFNADIQNLEVFEQPNGTRIAYAGIWGQVRIDASGKLLSWENKTDTPPPPSILNGILSKADTVKIGSTINPVAPVTPKVSDSRMQEIIQNANNILYSSLSADERDALNAYLINNNTALVDKNFSTFQRGSIMAWALGMGETTNLSENAKSLGFVTYDSASDGFNKAPVTVTETPPEVIAPPENISHSLTGLLLINNAKIDTATHWESLTASQQQELINHFGNFQDVRTIVPGTQVAYIYSLGSVKPAVGTINGAFKFDGQVWVLQDDLIPKTETPPPVTETPPVRTTHTIDKSFGGDSWTMAGLTERYYAVQSSIVSYTVDTVTAPDGKTTYTVTVNFSDGQKYNKFFENGQAIADFLKNNWGTVETINAMSDQDFAMFVALADFHSKDPVLSAIIAGNVPTGNLATYSAGDYDVGHVQWGYNPWLWSSPEEAKTYQAWFPGSTIIEQQIPPFPGATVKWDPNDSRRMFALQLPDGTVMNIGTFRNSLSWNAQKGQFEIWNLSENLAKYLNPPAGIKVMVYSVGTTTVINPTVIGETNTVTGGGSGGSVTEGTQQYTWSFTNNTTGNATKFEVGDSWTIKLTGAPNQNVTVIGGKDGKFATTVMGKTNAQGIFTLSGTMAAADIGTWMETWKIGDVAVGSFGFDLIAKSTASAIGVPLPTGDNLNPLNAEYNAWVNQVYSALVAMNKGTVVFKAQPYVWTANMGMPTRPLDYYNVSVGGQRGGSIAPGDFGKDPAEIAKQLYLSVEDHRIFGESPLAQKALDEMVLFHLQNPGAIWYNVPAGQTWWQAFGYTQSQINALLASAGTSGIGIDQPLTTNTAKTVVISKVEAFDKTGKSVSTYVGAGYTIQVSGSGLTAYNKVTLVSGNEEFTITGAQISANKITLTLPNLAGKIDNGSFIQVKLYSADSSVKQGLIAQPFIYTVDIETIESVNNGVIKEEGKGAEATNPDDLDLNEEINKEVGKEGSAGEEKESGEEVSGEELGEEADLEKEESLEEETGQEEKTYWENLNNNKKAGESEAIKVNNVAENKTGENTGIKKEAGSQTDEKGTVYWQNLDKKQQTNEVIKKQTDPKTLKITDLAGNEVETGDENNTDYWNQLDKKTQAQTNVSGGGTGGGSGSGGGSVSIGGGGGAGSYWQNLNGSGGSSSGSGQVSVLGGVARVQSSGLQMPTGGLKMPAGYPASEGLKMPEGYVAGEEIKAGQNIKGTYKVKKGDTLWAISKKYYGDGKKWRKILEANTGKVKNTRALKIGTELVIPEI